MGFDGPSNWRTGEWHETAASLMGTTRMAYLPGAGALLALLGGWLGTLLLGVLFATATAILVAVAGVTVCAMVRENLT